MVVWRTLPDYVQERAHWMEEYKKHFGEHSLDYVILPVDIFAEEAFRESIRDLKRAIKTNKPLDNGPPDPGLENLIF